MKLKTLLLLATLASGLAAMMPAATQAREVATEVAGVTLKDTLTVQDSELRLNGAGVRSKYFIDLYVGSLYLPAPSSDPSQILNIQTVAIRLDITSGLIDKEKMRAAISEGFEKATGGDPGSIAAQITQFMALFAEEIAAGDNFTLVADKTQGVAAYKNGVAQATITGEDFRLALLTIWLGEAPAQESLKTAMLGL
jgi:hypothetical protein